MALQPGFFAPVLPAAAAAFTKPAAEEGEGLSVASAGAVTAADCLVVERYRCDAIGRRWRGAKLRHSWNLRLSGGGTELGLAVEILQSRVSGRKRVLVDGREVFCTRSQIFGWSFEHAASCTRITLRSEGDGFRLSCEPAKRQSGQGAVGPDPLGATLPNVLGTPRGVDIAPEVGSRSSSAPCSSIEELHPALPSPIAVVHFAVAPVAGGDREGPRTPRRRLVAELPLPHPQVNLPERCSPATAAAESGRHALPELAMPWPRARTLPPHLEKAACDKVNVARPFVKVELAAPAAVEPFLGSPRRAGSVSRSAAARPAPRSGPASLIPGHPAAVVPHPERPLHPSMWPARAAAHVQQLTPPLRHYSARGSRLVVGGEVLPSGGIWRMPLLSA